MSKTTRITLELLTADGAVGTKQIFPANGDKLDWTFEPEVQTETATFRRYEGDAAHPAEELVLTGDAWRELESSRDFAELVADAAAGYLEGAVRAQLDEVESTYTHCGQTWTSVWSGACNDECPVCGKEIEPSDSVTLSGLVETGDGRFDYQVNREAATA